MKFDNENIDLLVFFVVILGLTAIFIFAGLKLDKYREGMLPDGMEEIP